MAYVEVYPKGAEATRGNGKFRVKSTSMQGE